MALHAQWCIQQVSSPLVAECVYSHTHFFKCSMLSKQVACTSSQVFTMNLTKAQNLILPTYKASIVPLGYCAVMLGNQMPNCSPCTLNLVSCYQSKQLLGYGLLQNTQKDKEKGIETTVKGK